MIVLLLLRSENGYLSACTLCQTPQSYDCGVWPVLIGTDVEIVVFYIARVARPQQERWDYADLRRLSTSTTTIPTMMRATSAPTSKPIERISSACACILAASSEAAEG